MTGPHSAHGPLTMTLSVKKYGESIVFKVNLSRLVKLKKKTAIEDFFAGTK